MSFFGVKEKEFNGYLTQDEYEKLCNEMNNKQDKEWKKILAEYLRKVGILRSGIERIEIHCNDNNIATVKTLEKHN